MRVSTFILLLFMLSCAHEPNLPEEDSLPNANDMGEHAFDPSLEWETIAADQWYEDVLETSLVPCSGPEDCVTLLCLEVPQGGKFCSEPCFDRPCPSDWKCVQTVLGGDPYWLCLPMETYLCRPCVEHADCAPKGVILQNYCLQQGDTWFCGQDCQAGCPAGFRCEEVVGVGGVEQCVPVSGECACTEEFAKAGYVARCVVENDWGRCEGRRVCTENGLSPCSAKTPGPEKCDLIDNDCDGFTDPDGSAGCLYYYMDADGDLFGTGEPRCLCAPEGLFKALKDGDCADFDPGQNPGAQEICDGKDNDCDGETDEEGAIGCATYFADRDGDGFGNKADARCLCESKPPYRVQVWGDCDDLDPLVCPGCEEVCDGKDNNCDGATDEEGAKGCKFLFWDGDGDGFGSNMSACLCGPTLGYTATQSGDCNDSDPSINPLAPEACNSKDDNCDGVTDPEGSIGCSVYYYDGDQDQFGIAGNSKCLCYPQGKYSALNHADCDDTDPNVHPGAPEVCGNGKDDNCNGLQNEEFAVFCAWLYRDEDGDGFGVDSDSKCLCFAEGLYRATIAGDCDDKDSNINPSAPEQCATPWDDNCNNVNNEEHALGCVTFYADYDRDGFGSGLSACYCEGFGIFSAGNALDCDDNNSNVYPGAAEVCNNIDDNCNGETDEGENLAGCRVFYFDADGDSVGVFPSRCLCQPSGYFRAGTLGDCDDSNASVFPGAPEVCDGLDNDCDGFADEDFDNFPDHWPGPFGPDPFDPWRYPNKSFGSVYEWLTPTTDVDYFSIEVFEANLSQCVPMNCRVTLSGIPEGYDFRLCACWSDIMECDLSGGTWICSDNPGNAAETVTITLEEMPPPPASCKVSGIDLQQHAYCDVLVSRVSGPTGCPSYQLSWIVWEGP